MSDKKEKRIRCHNFSPRDEDILLSLVEKFKSIVESKKTDAVSWEQKREIWNKIKYEFCAQTGSERTQKMLKEKYENMKRKTKTLMAAEKREIYMTGGGSRSISQPSCTNNRLAALMGEGATGLDNKYDGDSTWNESVEIIANETDVQADLIELLNETDVPVLENRNRLSASKYSGESDANNDMVTQEVHPELPEHIDVPESEMNKNWSTWNPSALKTKMSPKLYVGKKFKKTNADDPNLRVVNAQAVFFENEEMRAAERHNWEKELNTKRQMWEENFNNKRLELLNLQIEREKNM